MSATKWKKKIDKALIRAVYFSGLSFSIMKNVTESFLKLYEVIYCICRKLYLFQNPRSNREKPTQGGVTPIF